MSDNPYVGPHTIRIPNGILTVGAKPFKLIDTDGKWWLCEWHSWFGPHSLNKRTGEVKDNQEPERSRFWLLAQWWHNQGAVVIDGVGQWREPPRTNLTPVRRIGPRSCLVLREPEPGCEFLGDYDHKWPGTPWARPEQKGGE